MYVQTAVIRGRGEFPVDMLRYDRCAPESETDSYKLRDSIVKGGPWEITVTRHVHAKTAKWSVARWQSFAVDITPGPTTKLEV